MRLFYYFNFETNYDVQKSKSPCIFLNKNINFNKNETENGNRKWEISHTVLERQTLCFSSYKNHKLKLKLMSWSSAFFVPFILPKRNFFNICVLSQSMYSVLNRFSEYKYFFT